MNGTMKKRQQILVISFLDELLSFLHPSLIELTPDLFCINIETFERPAPLIAPLWPYLGEICTFKSRTKSGLNESPGFTDGHGRTG